MAPSARTKFRATEFRVSAAILALHEIGPVPPSAAERLVEGDGVGVTAGLGLYEGDARLLVALLGAEQRQVVGVTCLVLLLRKFEGRLSRVGRGGVGLQRLGVLVEGDERIG